MKFYVMDAGDEEGGIFGFTYEIIFPDVCEGWYDDDMVVMIKNFLRELYDAKVCMTEKEYEEWVEFMNKGFVPEE